MDSRWSKQNGFPPIAVKSMSLQVLGRGCKEIWLGPSVFITRLSTFLYSQSTTNSEEQFRHWVILTHHFTLYLREDDNFCTKRLK